MQRNLICILVQACIVTPVRQPVQEKDSDFKALQRHDTPPHPQNTQQHSSFHHSILKHSNYMTLLHSFTESRLTSINLETSTNNHVLLTFGELRDQPHIPALLTPHGLAHNNTVI